MRGPCRLDRVGELDEIPAHDGDVEDVAFLQGQLAIGHPWDAEPADGNHTPAAVEINLDGALPDELLGDGDRGYDDLSVINRVFDRNLIGKQRPEDLVGGPSDRRDRLDPESLIDLCPAGVVDPSHDLTGSVVLLRDAGADDVGVITARDGGEGLRVLDAGRFQDLAIERDADDLLPAEVRFEPFECLGILVDDGDGVSESFQIGRQFRSDSTATGNNYVHLSSLTRGSAGILPYSALVAFFSKLVEKLARPPEDVRAENVRDWAESLDGTTRIASLEPRCRCKVAGVIQNIRIDPRQGRDSIEVTITDGTGQMLAKWLGRQTLAGVQLGVGLVIEGIVGVQDRDPLILNPEYQLVPGPEHG